MEANESDELTLPLRENADRSEVEPTSSVKFLGFSYGKYKDVLFLALFVLSLFLVGGVALSYGAVTLFSSGAEFWIIRGDGVKVEDKASDDLVRKVMIGVLFILSLSTVLSLAWVYLLSYVAIFMVNAVIISLVVLAVLGAVVVLSMGYPSFGFLLLGMGVLTLALSLLFQSRIDFASVNLDVACKAIVAMPSTIGYSLMVLLLQASYVMVWCIAAVGFATNDANVSRIFGGKEYELDQCSSYRYSNTFAAYGVTLTCPAGSNCNACFCDGTLVSQSPCFRPRFYWGALSLLLLALIWTSSVLVNVVHCTVVAAVARWWSAGQCTVEELQGFYSTFTSTSLGSICFGSLLGAVVRTLRAVVAVIHRIAGSRTSNRAAANGGFLAQMLHGLNRWAWGVLVSTMTFLDRLIVYFNRYAFCYVAIEEFDYIHASFAAASLFRARGLTALFNDDLLDCVLYVSHGFIACMTLIAAYIYGSVVHLPQSHLILLVVFGACCGWVMAAVVLSSIGSAITAVYVCFARDPDAFEQSHPNLYPALANSWNKIFPGCLHYSESLAPSKAEGMHSKSKIVISNKRPMMQQQPGPKRNNNTNNNTNNSNAYAEPLQHQSDEAASAAAGTGFYRNSKPSSSNAIRGSYGASPETTPAGSDSPALTSAAAGGAAGGAGGSAGLNTSRLGVLMQMVQKSMTGSTAGLAAHTHTHTHTPASTPTYAPVSTSEDVEMTHQQYQHQHMEESDVGSHNPGDDRRTLDLLPFSRIQHPVLASTLDSFNAFFFGGSSSRLGLSGTRDQDHVQLQPQSLSQSQSSQSQQPQQPQIRQQPQHQQYHHPQHQQHHQQQHQYQPQHHQQHYGQPGPAMQRMVWGPPPAASQPFHQHAPYPTYHHPSQQEQQQQYLEQQQQRQQQQQQVSSWPNDFHDEVVSRVVFTGAGTPAYDSTAVDALDFLPGMMD